MNLILRNYFICALLLCAISYIRCDEEEEPEVCPRIVTRRDWGARSATGVNYITIPVQNVIVHHTVSTACANEKTCSRYVKNTQYYHQDMLQYWDIGYNFLIGNDGNVYEGIGWHKEGAHTYGYNKNSIAIAFIGDFSDEMPSNKAIKAAKSLLECGKELGELSNNYNVYAARQVSSTESPGLSLYQDIQDWPHFRRDVE